MALKRPPTGTNSVPAAHWHTIQVVPAPVVPKIHFYDKFNPVWWLENADDPLPPAWYRPGDRRRALKWSFRNPFHNFDHFMASADPSCSSRISRERLPRTPRLAYSNPPCAWATRSARRFAQPR